MSELPKRPSDVVGPRPRRGAAAATRLGIGCLAALIAIAIVVLLLSAVIL